jgi:hypothetical protein
MEQALSLSIIALLLTVGTRYHRHGISLLAASRRVASIQESSWHGCREPPHIVSLIPAFIPTKPNVSIRHRAGFRVLNVNQHTSWPARINVLAVSPIIWRPAAVALFFC